MLYFASSVFLSAFLLFQIQPMIGRFILPWFGGAPAVWSTLMLFFQALLTGGYAYAYWLMARFRSFHQGIIHLALVGLSLCIILALGVLWPSPITPDTSWKPQGVEFPVWNIFKSLVHGITQHGFQFEAADKRDLPTSYYIEEGGAGLAILNHPKYGQGMQVGVLGLGVGTLATYGQPGDVYRFYEINPAVVRLAEGQAGYFSFLADSRAEVTVVLGDARLSLENELAAGERHNFDILVLDTFSSDAIPVHLLTREAFELYLQHLQPEGILALHITNHHLDLRPVVWKLADNYSLSRVLVDSEGDGVRGFRSIWMLLARDPALLDQPAIARNTTPLGEYKTSIRLWTDDYSNLFQILK